jgi:hypothetical protein
MIDREGCVLGMWSLRPGGLDMFGSREKPPDLLDPRGF